MELRTTFFRKRSDGYIHDAKIIKVNGFYIKKFKRINRKTVEKPIAP